jgi:hypothetical protein
MRAWTVVAAAAAAAAGVFSRLDAPGAIVAVAAGLGGALVLASAWSARGPGAGRPVARAAAVAALVAVVLLPAPGDAALLVPSWAVAGLGFVALLALFPRPAADAPALSGAGSRLLGALRSWAVLVVMAAAFAALLLMWGTFAPPRLAALQEARGASGPILFAVAVAVPAVLYWAARTLVARNRAPGRRQGRVRPEPSDDAGPTAPREVAL